MSAILFSNNMPLTRSLVEIRQPIRIHLFITIVSRPITPKIQICIPYRKCILPPFQDDKVGKEVIIAGLAFPCLLSVPLKLRQIPLLNSIVETHWILGLIRIRFPKKASYSSIHNGTHVKMQIRSGRKIKFVGFRMKHVLLPSRHP